MCQHHSGIGHTRPHQLPEGRIPTVAQTAPGRPRLRFELWTSSSKPETEGVRRSVLSGVVGDLVDAKAA